MKTIEGAVEICIWHLWISRNRMIRLIEMLCGGYAGLKGERKFAVSSKKLLQGKRMRVCREEGNSFH